MPKTITKIQYPEKSNPFLTERAAELWRLLDKDGKPVSKEKLLERAETAKAKSRKHTKH